MSIQTSTSSTQEIKFESFKTIPTMLIKHKGKSGRFLWFIAVANVRCIGYTVFGPNFTVKLRPGIIVKLIDHAE